MPEQPLINSANPKEEMGAEAITKLQLKIALFQGMNIPVLIKKGLERIEGRKLSTFEMADECEKAYQIALAAKLYFRAGKEYERQENWIKAEICYRRAEDEFRRAGSRYLGKKNSAQCAAARMHLSN